IWRARGGEAVLPERRNHQAPHFVVTREDIARHSVRIEDLGTEILQHPADGRFPAPDAAGNGDDFRFRRLCSHAPTDSRSSTTLRSASRASNRDSPHDGSPPHPPPATSRKVAGIASGS